MYYGYELSQRSVGFKGGPIVDKKELKGGIQSLNDWLIENRIKSCYPYRSRIGDACTVGDLCVRGYDDLEYKKIAFTKKEQENGEWAKTPEGRIGDKFRWTKEYKEYLLHSHENGGLFDMGNVDYTNDRNKYQLKWPSSMDGFSYLLAMNHNVEVHIDAIQTANKYQDMPIEEARHHLTPDLLEFRDLCPEIFTSECPMDLINKHAKMLQQITGMDANNDVSMDIEDM